MFTMTGPSNVRPSGTKRAYQQADTAEDLENRDGINEATLEECSHERAGLAWDFRHRNEVERFQQFVASLEQPNKRLTVGNLLGQETSPKKNPET
jgi:hypothetical protein